MIHTDGIPTVVSAGTVKPDHWGSMYQCECQFRDEVHVCKCKEEDHDEYGIYDSEA